MCPDPLGKKPHFLFDALLVILLLFIDWILFLLYCFQLLILTPSLFWDESTVVPLMTSLKIRVRSIRGKKLFSRYRA